MGVLLALVLIYLGIGFGAEFINDAQQDDKFGFDKKSVMRILTWPKHVLGVGSKE